MSKYYRFPCGCSWPVIKEFDDPDRMPLLDFNVDYAPRDCQATWDLLGRGETKGVFQLESPLGKQWTKKLKPENLEHIGALGAILRPGCLKAVDEDGVSTTQHFCRRKNGEEEVPSIHPAVDPILAPTYGLIVYQEQAMALAAAVAGFNLQEADVLRKAIGKKLAEEMAKCRTMFLEGVEKCGIIPKELGEHLFDQIEKSQRYSFNKSHAYCYGIGGYETAYIKAHFPLAFFTSWLRQTKDSQEVFDLVNDAKLYDIQVEPPNLLVLGEHFQNDGYKITFGLADIKGVGDAQVVKLKSAVAEAEELLKKPLKDWTWFEFLIFFTPLSSANVITRLIQVGAVRWMGVKRQRMLAEYEAWSSLTSTEQEWIVNRQLAANGYYERDLLEIKQEELNAWLAENKDADKEVIKAKKDELKIAKGLIAIINENRDGWDNLVDALKDLAHLKPAKGRDTNGGCQNEKRVSIVSGQEGMLRNPPTSLDDSLNWIAWIEEELLGIPVTCSRIDSCDISQVNCTCKEFLAGRTGYLMFGVEIQMIREVKTKRGKTPGQKMAFLTITDGTCCLEDVVCFPEAYKEFKHVLAEGNTVIIQGEREDKRGSSTLFVKNVWQADMAAAV